MDDEEENEDQLTEEQKLRVPQKSWPLQLVDLEFILSDVSKIGEKRVFCKCELPRNLQ